MITTRHNDYQVCKRTVSTEFISNPKQDSLCSLFFFLIIYVAEIKMNFANERVYSC